jgi:hypothetical protein
MPSLLLFRFGSKARTTSWGIALCTMFIVASFAVADGLRASTENLAGNFSSEYSLITKKGLSGPTVFDPAGLPSGGSYAFGIFAVATVAETQSRATVFAVNDTELVLKETLSAPRGIVLMGQGQSYPGTITLTAESSVVVSVPGRYSSTMFPSSWLLGDEDLLRQLSGLAEGFNFAIAKDLPDDAGLSLESGGFAVQPLIGIIEFLNSGTEEIRSDAMWVLFPSTFVIAVLAHSFVGSETSDRRHEIGIMKTIGAGRWRILRLLTVNAMVISVWGGVLGLALGVVLSYGVSTAASSLFTSVFMMKAGEELLLYSFIATVGAAVAGAFLPALRMTLSKPVDDLKEAVSSS